MENLTKTCTKLSLQREQRLPHPAGSGYKLATKAKILKVQSQKKATGLALPLVSALRNCQESTARELWAPGLRGNG